MKNIESLRAELKHQYNLLRTIASDYLTVHEIDLVNNTYYEYNVTTEVNEFLKLSKNADVVMRNIFSNITLEEDRESTLEFTEFSTLRERLKDRKAIVHEYRGKYNGWIRAKFIVSERDYKGYPTKVIHITEVIEKEKKREEELKKLSFIDEITNLFNRRAYERDMKNIRFSSKNNVVYLTFDLNSLKRINDSMGHQEGDKAIKIAALCIHDIFSEFGKCYRIGGDEFVSILKCPNDYIETLIINLNEYIDYYNVKRNKKVSISIGYASSSEENVSSMQELASIADKRMYENKKQFYENNKELVRRKN